MQKNKEYIIKIFNYKIIVSYDGTNYYGFQKQLTLKTIQLYLENAINNITKKKNIKIYGASRTDKGVHAIGQVINFKVSFFIPPNNILKALNAFLPLDIRILKVSLISNNFHARFSSKSKIYHYFFAKKPLDIFNYRYQVYWPNLDFDKIKKALCYIEGKHDFSLFTSNKNLKSYQRNIFKTQLKETQKHFCLIFHGDGFMQYMIRFLVGYLIEIALNKKSISELQKMLALKVNLKANLLAPAKGLILKQIFY